MFIYLGRRAAKYYVTGGIGNPTSSRSVLDSVIMSAGLLLVLLATIASSYEDDTCDGKDTIPAINLKNNLFCNYYPDIRPVRNHQNTTKVTIRMILKYFTYDELSSSLEVDSWMSMHWKDEHLTWDPKKYDGIESITLKDSEIWMPDISIYNRANQGGSPAAVEGAHCIVASTGIVVCVPPTHHTALCVADLTKFPFDEQNCSLRFGSWVHAGEEINFTLSDPAILLDDIESNGDWEIVKSNAFRFPGVYKSMPNNTYPSLHFSFKIKRLYSSHSATVIIPSVDTSFARCEPKNYIPEIQLKDTLFCNYNPDTRPVLNYKNSVQVKVGMSVMGFEYNDVTRTFEVDSWVTMQWYDDHLKWDPQRYGGMSSVPLREQRIWTPDLAMYNRENFGDSPFVLEKASHCVLYYNGLVKCTPPLHFTAGCITDLTNFPFDMNMCTLYFGSSVYNGLQVNFTLSKPSLSLDLIRGSSDWKIIKAEAFAMPSRLKSYPSNTTAYLRFVFEIKRLHSGHGAMYFGPSLVIFITTLTSLWISPTNKDRLTLCYVNFVSQFMHLQYISYSIPIKGDNVPKLVSYSRDSLLLCTFTIVLTVILKNLICTKNQAPSWVSSFVSFLIGCRPGQIILLNDYSLKGVASAKGEEDGSTIVANTQSNTEENQDWLIFAKVIDRLCFIIYCIIYIIMLIAFTP